LQSFSVFQLDARYDESVGRPTHSRTGADGLQRCSNAVCTMPLRAPLRVLNQLTPGNSHTQGWRNLGFQEKVF